MLISVALPIYNGGPLLREALASILAQDVELEVVVSDDGSNDGSIATVEGFRDNRVRVLRNTSNAGIFGNLNRAIRATRGDHIQVFSQDDVMLPGYLASQTAMLSRHPDGGVVYGAARSIDGEGREQKLEGHDGTPEVVDSRLYVWIASHYGALPASISSIMISRRALETVGHFDESYRVAGDVEFYNRVSEHFVLIRNSEARHAVRTHAGMATVHSSSGPRYLAEESRLEPWFRRHWTEGDWREIRRFRAAVRGSYHLGWIKRRIWSGRFSEAAMSLRALNRLYPLRDITWALAARRLRSEADIYPTVPPPSRKQESAT